MKREHPDLFRVQRNVEAAGMTFSAIGNRFLLDRPVRLQVQCSRRLSEAEIQEQVAHFLTAARQGAVLVSPAISPGEKAVMRAAFNEGLPLIYLQENGLKGFDIVHIAAVLMHLADASRVLKEIYNYMNDGATSFIQDEDDAFNVTFPKNKFLDDALDIWEHSIESGDRKMGRKIPSMLRESGFTDVKLLSTTVSSLDFNGENKEQLWDMYYNSDLWVVDSASFFDSRLAYEKFLRYKDHHAELKARYMQGDIFATLGVLFLSAKKKNDFV